MKFFLASLILAGTLNAQSWSLERLFTRPFAWGTPPEKITWSKQGHTLLFLWNAEGGRFRDLYSYQPDTQKLLRLTQLEGVRDDLNRSAAEKDPKQKAFLMPPEGLTGFDIARDGNQAAFSYRGDLYTVRTDGAQPPFRLTRTKDAEVQPRFSPDGASLAFLRGGQLFVQDLKNGRLTQITDAEDPAALTGYTWAPDGKHFLYTVRAAQGRKLLLPNYSGRVVTAQPFNRSLAGDEPGETKTYVIPAAGGEATLMEPGPWGAKVFVMEDPAWAPDSRHILQRLVNRNLKKAQLVVQDAGTGKAAVAFEDSDAAWIEVPFAAWSPDSREILFTSERDGWSHLYTVSSEGGTPRQLTRGPWEIHTDEIFARDPQWIGDFIYYSSTENGTAERQFYRIRPDGSGKQRLSSREGMNIGVVSEDGRFTAMMEAGLKNPFDLYVNEHRVTTSPRPEFWKYQWPEARFVSFPSRRDRKPVAAKLLLPPGYRPEDRNQKPRPAILFIHGSGYATSVLKQWGAYHELRFAFNCYLASKGYVILDMDYRGSSGYGRDWRTGVYLHMGGPDLEDVLGGVDYLRGLGNIDMARVGIWGSSYGGFMTAMAMFLSPDTFRAGAAFSSVTDWENYNAFYTEQRLTTPEENPEAYRRSSPIHYAGMLKNHLLIVHGIIDSNVLFQDAVQLSEKLIRERKDFEQAFYPEENHLFVRDETLIDAFRRTAGFVDRYLQ